MPGPPDAPIIAKPGTLALSQTFLVPSIEVVVSKPSNTGVLFCFLSLFDCGCLAVRTPLDRLCSARVCHGMSLP